MLHWDISRLKTHKLKGRLSFFYLFDYLPKNQERNILEEDEIVRQSIWNFKHGINNTFRPLVTSSVKKIVEESAIDASKVTFCIIPASTEEKTIKRYFNFCKAISDSTGLINGYDLIKLTEDHEETKGNRKKEVLDFLHFDKESIKGKCIILFDDILTTGRSFEQCHSRLMDLGATKVLGLFLGKTSQTPEYASRKHKESMDMLIESGASESVEWYFYGIHEYTEDIILSSSDIGDLRLEAYYGIAENIVNTIETAFYDEYFSIENRQSAFHSFGNKIYLVKRMDYQWVHYLLLLDETNKYLTDSRLALLDISVAADIYDNDEDYNLLLQQGEWVRLAVPIDLLKRLRFDN